MNSLPSNDSAVATLTTNPEAGRDFQPEGYETDSLSSTTTSLASSILSHTFENGRRYHRFREGAYPFPNDTREQEREVLIDAVVMELCQQLHFAPIGRHPQNILDLGTGVGLWAIGSKFNLGDLYPSSNVLGIDLSPIQPLWVPPNVSFVVDDVESPWLQPPNYFDYIHARNTVMAIRDWPSLMRQAFDSLKPGGWFELQEIHYYPQCHDGSMPPDYLLAQFWDLINDALAALGVNLMATPALPEMMQHAGFSNVTVRIFHIPIGPWPKNRVLKNVGLGWRTILSDGLQSTALGPVTRGLNWTKEQMEVNLVEARKACMDERVHSHMPLYIIYGQKPGGVVKSI